MFCSFNCVNFNWHIYCNVNKQLLFFDLVFSIWGKSSAISAHVQKKKKEKKKNRKKKTRKALTSFKCISEEVHLPLWAWNSENSFMVEACDTHKHIFTPYDAFIDAWYAQVHKKNTKQVLPPTHFHCPKLSQHDLLIWQKLTHHEGLWSECSFQPPQESAVQSSAEKRRLEEERWDENAVLKTETECRGRCKERGRKKRMKERKTNNREGKYAGRKMQCKKLKMTEKYKFHQLRFF